ncbi:MAG: hypothetical protein WA781_11115, partial [Pseudolabrys sp.]
MQFRAAGPAESREIAANVLMQHVRFSPLVGKEKSRARSISPAETTRQIHCVDGRRASPEWA